jgi:hypothetical protein
MMSKHTEAARVDAESNDVQVKNRRDFLKSLGKWSTIIIGGIALGGAMAPDDTAGWLNGGGGSWVNARGGGGGGWVNRSGGGGGGWVNRSGGSGGSWVNRRGY